jgi:hypothetical protein
MKLMSALFVSFLIILTGYSLFGATFIVNTTADTNTPGTLRWAINSANGSAGPDTINFNIPGTGPHTIFVTSQLPILSDVTGGTVINGLTQPGSSAGGNPPSTAILMVVLDGSNAGPSHGIWIVTAFNEVHGLVIQNFEQDGIRIQASPDGAFGNFIYCNFVGTDVTGTVQQGNGTNQQMYWAGISIICTPSVPGLAFDNHLWNNLVSSNYAEGVGISNCPPGDVYNNIVLYNYIGTDITGTLDFGNQHDGVYIGEGAHDNAIDNNLISGNDFEGVCIVGYAELQIPTYRNIIIQNIIGLDINLSPLQNTMDGISIGQYGNIYQGGFAPANVVDTNIIAHNGNNGVTVWEHPSTTTNCDTNFITRNSIYNNTLIGIDLNDDGVTLNDGGDPDQGPNCEVNFPVITSAVYSPGTGQTLIQGTLDIDTPPNQAQIEVFLAIIDATGYGEGATYLGVTTPTVTGNWSITVTSLVTGNSITATTTDMNWNTSEFCQNYVVTVGVEEVQTERKHRFVLKQNYPNPFKTGTFIQFSLPQAAEVSLTVYDITGKLIKVLASGEYSASLHSLYWDGKDCMGNRIMPGVYFYKLCAGDFEETRKLILTK